ncbi:MAG TPA: hypothetical protein VKT31_08900 [Solirubrobacteraceae bacterium]|nr:hypothetical protein [Solirubrobacteraceae bacterium]
MPLAHIVGIPVEETRSGNGPVILAATAALGCMVPEGARRVRRVQSRQPKP